MIPLLFVLFLNDLHDELGEMQESLCMRMMSFYWQRVRIFLGANGAMLPDAKLSGVRLIAI